MVKNDLIDRYIYAVTKHMKSAMKKDVAAELETIIQDMLEERCEDVTPTERDIKVVLTELGTPDELASKYNGETQDCLIGQPYYSLYMYVLKIVTACISGGMLLAQIMAALTSHTIWYIAIYRTIGGIFGGMLTGFAFVTLLFAFFYKKGIKVDGLNDGIDNLPPVPQKSNRISKVDAIVGIVFSVIFTLVFLVCPQILCIAFVKNGVGVYEPLFNLEYIRQTWYFILVFGILGVTRDSVRLIDGSYTKRVMLVTIITNIIDGVLTSIWLLNDRIMKWKNMLLTVGSVFILAACEKQDIPVFTSDDHGIYFQRVSSYIYGSPTEYYGDSTAFSFASTTVFCAVFALSSSDSAAFCLVSFISLSAVFCAVINAFLIVSSSALYSSIRLARISILR